MEVLTKRITEWLIVNKAVEDGDRELYEYAIYSLMITISPLFLVLIIGIMMGTLIEGVFLIIPFMCIRKFSGGYHAKNAGTCFVSSCALLVICMYLAAHIKYGVWVSFVATVAIALLALFSPIDSENRRLDEEEKKLYRKIAIKISLLFMLVHILLLLFKCENWAVSVAIGLMLSAGLQLPCLLQQLNQRIQKLL